VYKPLVDRQVPVKLATEFMGPAQLMVARGAVARSAS